MHCDMRCSSFVAAEVFPRPLGCHKAARIEISLINTISTFSLLAPRISDPDCPQPGCLSEIHLYRPDVRLAMIALQQIHLVAGVVHDADPVACHVPVQVP